MSCGKANWRLLKECAEGMLRRGIRQFTRDRLIRCVIAEHPEAKPQSLSPIIQRMTVNAPGGAPGAPSEVFFRVSRGLYEIYNPERHGKVKKPPASGRSHKIPLEGLTGGDLKPGDRVIVGNRRAVVLALREQPIGGTRVLVVDSSGIREDVPIWEVRREYRQEEEDGEGSSVVIARSSRGERRRAAINRRLMDLEGQFERWLRSYDQDPPFSRPAQLSSHRRTIELRRGHGSVVAALKDELFLSSLRETLREWGLGRRGSRLVSRELFVQRLQTVANKLHQLESLTIEDRGDEVDQLAGRIWHIIQSVDVVENAARIVAGTKLLHHLLPDLVIPFDRAWTGTFFLWQPEDLQRNQRRAFTEAFEDLAHVAQVVQPSKFVGLGWRTATAKLLDNALIGYLRETGIKPL